MNVPDTAERLTSLLGYIEQVVRLDERPAMQLSEHRLPTGQAFAIHQHELNALPGVAHDLVDDDGPVWLKIERLRRGTPPTPPEELIEWIELSPDPDRPPVVRGFLLRTVSDNERLAMVETGAARAEDCAEAVATTPQGIPRWDVRLRFEDRPELQQQADVWIEATWLPWAMAERPVRKTLALYQRFFEVAQLAEMGGGDSPFEMAWGIGVARWKTDGNLIDLPLIERLVEIDLDEAEGATIKIRPRNAPAAVNLRPYDHVGVQGVSLAYDASRRVLETVNEDEDVSPFLRDSYESILRVCQARLDSEGIYLPDSATLPPDGPLPTAGDRLMVSDRWVIYGRRRSNSFLLADLENLKGSIERAAKNDDIPGPAKTLVMGPEQVSAGTWAPLTDRVGDIGASKSASSADTETGDLFFPKAFNDEQIEIVRRLKKSDGIVVQGPPGTGKTHTISNIICHAMATGQRVLVVSHGEPALAVLRDQLPDEVRDLAISITATEREGFRQLESAVRILQSIVENIRESEQSRLIRDIEASIVGLRTRLATTDAEIQSLAHEQLAPAFGGKQPDELAKFVVSARDCLEWFEDRPAGDSAQIAPSDETMERLRAARASLDVRLEHLGTHLPSVEDLPDGDMLARWHESLRQSKTYAAAAASDPSIRVKLDDVENVGTALAAAAALEDIRRTIALAEARPWLKAISDQWARNEIDESLLRLFHSFVEEARPVVQERQRYIEAPVEVPDDGALSDADVFEIVQRLAEGEKVFGLLSFRERALRPHIDAIRISGRSPADTGDWTHIRDHLAWRTKVQAVSARWRALAEEVGAPPISSPRELAHLSLTIESVMIGAPKAVAAAQASLSTLLPAGIALRSLWTDPARLAAIENALRNAAAAAQLSAVRSELSRLADLFTDGSGKTGDMARAILANAVGNDDIAPDRIRSVWTLLRRQVDDLRQRSAQFQTVSDICEQISRAGAPAWATRLRSEPAQADGDHALPPNWREAWDWAAAAAYLDRIDSRKRLRELADQRVRLDAELRKTFERLVRERTFYELGRSMTGPVRSALMMFATALRRIGKGTGKGAVRHRRDARLAMAQCYDAIPCWIMPTWRVAEQLPGEVGSFDLVIMDEASQSDIRELPALLRGKKILVVGDDKQVSPSAAFIENAKIDRLEHNFLRDQPFKTLLLPGASLYDLAKVMFPDKLVMLREHFRCVEPIIRFSMGFYPEPLVPLRVPDPLERLDPPLVDIFVPDGRRTGDKQNRREAEVILEEIRKIANDPALGRVGTTGRWRSIGVVSLIGSKQAALINRMILEDLGEDIVRRHRIACGDSATFQGNERDVMLLSMVADPSSKQAQTAMQFEQRFNVAMSRARDRLVLVRSVELEMLKPEDLKARVISHFVDPMAGAQVRKGDLEELCDSDFERAVLRHLVEMGYQVTPQVGALGYRIDLVVEGSAGRRLAVECDGDKYHGPERWADDMRRQRVLERVGWKFWRCWASSFVLDPAGCMADLVDTLQRLGIEPTGTVLPPSRYTAHITAANAQVSMALADAADNRPARAISVGDRVLLEYLDDKKQLTVTLTKDRSDLVNGFLAATSPLGAALIGKSEEDELEIKLEGCARTILVLRIDRADAA